MKSCQTDEGQGHNYMFGFSTVGLNKRSKKVLFMQFLVTGWGLI